MNSDLDIKKIIKRRSFLVIFVSFLLSSLILFRLFVLQIVNVDNYRKKSKKNRIQTKITPPSRGDIFDSEGNLVAGTVSNYNFILYKYLNKNYKTEINTFKKYITNDFFLENLKKHNSYKPFTIKKNISWKEIVSYEKNKYLFSSIKIFETKKRYYPNKNFSQIVGYMAESQTSLKEFPKGIFHIEKKYEDILKGSSGKIFNEVNAYGKIVRKISEEPSEKGGDLHLTINPLLQDFCQKTLPVDKKGSIVVIKSSDGSILSLNSNPTFNSQDFEDRNTNNINKYFSNIDKPLFNRAFSGFYPPGSVFKPLPALLGLEKKLINENTEFFCSGHSSIGSRNWYCWKKGGHGKVNLKRALKESCDVFFYELAKKININDLSLLASQMGYNQIYPIGLSNAHAGLVPNKKWKKDNLNESWYPGDNLNTCIGQGFNQASPLQLAVHYNSIINGGIYPSPKLLKNQKTKLLGRKININHQKILLNALDSVVNEPGGTANKLSYSNPNFVKIAGKTGTSQVKRIEESLREDEEYKKREVKEKFKDHSLFVGFGPVEKPKYIASVIIENGGSGSSLAAPLAHKVLNYANGLNV